MSDQEPFEEVRRRAWEYYQHADNLQHQRHNIFIVAQSIFFAAFATVGLSLWQMALPLAFVGIIYACVWFYLSERLWAGMDTLSKKYLEKDIVYDEYKKALKYEGPLSKQIKNRWEGRHVLNRFLPSVIIVAWILLLVALAYGASCAQQQVPADGPRPAGSARR